MSEQGEIKSLTGLRGLAAAYVVIFHFFPGVSFRNPLTTFVGHGYLAVDLFFVLSGFVMTLNYGHMFQSDFSPAVMWKFLGRRIARVYPLYFVATTCALVLILAGWVAAPPARSLATHFALNLAMVQAWGFGPSLDTPGWSISAEWAAYLLFPILLSVAYFRKSVWSWVALVVSVGLVTVLTRIPASLTHNAHPLALLDLSEAYHGFPVWRCLPEFTLGILAAGILGEPAAVRLCSKRWSVYSLSLAVLLLLAAPGADLAVVLLFPLLIVCLATGSHLPGRILSWGPVHSLGVISYSIYLVHDLLGGVIGWVHRTVQGVGIAHAQTYAAFVGIVLTLAIAAFAYRWIEAPGRGMLRGLFERGFTANIPPHLAAQPDAAANQA